MTSSQPAKKVSFDSPPAANGEASDSRSAQGTKEFWKTAPSLRQLSTDPIFLSSAIVQSTLAALSAKDSDDLDASSLLMLSLLHQQQTIPSQQRQYIDVDGPIDPEETLIRYDIPFAPKDPHRSLRLRKRVALSAGGTYSKASTSSSGNSSRNDGFLPGLEEVDPNVRVVLNSFILPRRWVDTETGVEWVQHAWPFPSSRTETMETQKRLKAKMTQLGAKRTGTCPIRTVLVAECFLEVMRQVVTECWERGLLMLHIHAERVASQAAHRELFESRVGHAMRLALKGEKDAMHAEEAIAELQAKVLALEQEEQQLKTLCGEFASFAEEQALIEEKQHNEALSALRKEGLIKRNQLEQMLMVPPP